MTFHMSLEESAAQLPKYELLARDIERAIIDQRLAEGDALPPEAKLAQIYGVSRGTVRKALAHLANKRLIVTKNGVGSRVIFQGYAIDDSRGWGVGLVSSDADSSATLSVDVIRIERVTDSGLAKKLGIEEREFIAIDRSRRLPTGTVVSLEYSRVLATVFPDLPETGLTDNSLTATITRAGLSASYGQEVVRVAALDEQAAGIFERPVGTRFLVTEKTMFDRAGLLVEHVTSLLDPDHFEYTNTFKDEL